MTHLAFLESFENGGQFAAAEAQIKDLPGYAEGFAAGKAEAFEQDTRLSAEFVSYLTDLKFGYAEAQQDLLHGLTPLIHMICDQILPDILDDLTRSAVFETLLIAAQADLTKPIRLSFHPTKSNAMEEIVCRFESHEFTVSCDQSLGLNEILIGVHNQETQLDAASMIKKLKHALDMVTATEGGSV